MILVAFASFNVSLHQIIHEHRTIGQCTESGSHNEVQNPDISSIAGEEELTSICDICDLINNHQKHVLISDNSIRNYKDTDSSQNFYSNNYSLQTPALFNSRGPPNT